ncbi:protein-disulfide reductase DsbD domain-containing protein [Luteolibacter sp. Populi]|uniref:protein-disulfide reductase DsbD domain-containing protein n=1 Tax=Luteolibacter sp. Populi TaxID=3230487 RepID=UPI0034671317
MKPLLALLLTLVSALAEPAATKGVDVTLLSESAAIAPGKKFTVGLKIHHHPGFHTYWRNPGIAGVPVKIDWQLPEGFAAGPIQWPYPEKSMMAIHPVHGFERDVLLMVEITPPASVSASRVDLKAAASWMACADGCYPGKKDLSLTLPIASETTPDPVAAEAFATARAELPQPLEHWKVEVLSEVDAPEIRLRLTPADDLAQVLAEPYFFSCDGQISSAPGQKVEIKDGKILEIIAPRAPYGPKGKKALPGVLISKTPLWKDGPLRAAIQSGGTIEATAAAAECECGK